MEIVGKITLLFASIGVLTGCISAPIRGPAVYALFIAIFIFYFSYELAPRTLKIPVSEFPGGRKKIITTGFMPFFIMWLVVWIMVYSLTI